MDKVYLQNDSEFIAVMKLLKSNTWKWSLELGQPTTTLQYGHEVFSVYFHKQSQPTIQSLVWKQYLNAPKLSVDF